MWVHQDSFDDVFQYLVECFVICFVGYSVSAAYIMTGFWQKLMSFHCMLLLCCDRLLCNSCFFILFLLSDPLGSFCRLSFPQGTCIYGWCLVLFVPV